MVGIRSVQFKHGERVLARLVASMGRGICSGVKVSGGYDEGVFVPVSRLVTSMV